MLIMNKDLKHNTAPEHDLEAFVKARTEVLRQEKEMYRSVFENTGTGTIIIDNDMLILFANAQFAALTGYEKSEIENAMRWSEFVIPEDNKKMQYYHYGRRKGSPDIPTEYECRIFNKDGDIKNIYMKVGMIPGTTRSIASFMDITQRKVAEKRLSESESQLKSIVSAFEGFIFTLSWDYKITFMNTTLTARVGYDAIGEKCYRVVHGLKFPCPWCQLKDVFMGEVSKREDKSPRDGRWYSVIQSPSYSRFDKVSGVQTIMMDITERKQQEEKIAEHANYYRSENKILRSVMKDRYRFGEIIGKSAPMQSVYDLILRAAASDAHVIITGESGTGKELVASAIHKLSSRSKHKFVPVNCGAISENIIESEFFGYRKGAFTGADKDKNGFLDTADKGTLFLDEIGDIGLNIQVKLLRSIEGGGFTPVGGNELKKPDLRIVAATNKNLKNLVKEGLMREDFFYRINIIPIKLPPLRERKEDLPLLIRHFLSKYDKNLIPPMDKHVMDAFINHNWPGNVRELQNTLDRYVTLNECEFLDTFAEPEPHGDESLHPQDMEAGPGDKNLNEILATVEKRIITKALEDNRWLKSKTAACLGIHRKTLFTKMKKHRLE
ncbi:PAS domain S-box-containing protein [Desulfocicer vacuolatum DSM 3385]|uniref:PAS domain S-box-containing protein n=1 Tax=Desulfocicer vacuolatum DSM 3385 TaxID=1121400 RepID=A0A1W2BYL0_9BACT|nr:PAS domain S-box-containing protein [Desulfocicer vacuolatum DSM 3385]